MDFEEAVKYDPAKDGFWVSLGLSYRILKKYEEALSALQEAVGINPSDATAWLFLGKTYDALHSYDQSLRCYKNATVNGPNDAEAWYELGHVTKNEDESIAAFSRAVSIKPDYVEAWTSLALAFDTEKRYGDAIAAWKKRLALKSNAAYLTDARAWWFIGGAYENQNDLKNAEQAYLEALRIEQALPNHTNNDNELIGNIFEALYLTYAKMGKHRESETYRKNFVWWEQNMPK